jgi:hypothetical protein
VWRPQEPSEKTGYSALVCTSFNPLEEWQESGLILLDWQEVIIKSSALSNIGQIADLRPLATDNFFSFFPFFLFSLTATPSIRQFRQKMTRLRSFRVFSPPSDISITIRYMGASLEIPREKRPYPLQRPNYLRQQGVAGIEGFWRYSAAKCRARVALRRVFGGRFRHHVGLVERGNANNR